jgi:hypothetical protein
MPRGLPKLWMYLLSWLLSLGLSTASGASQRTAAVGRTDSPPVIDGVLDDPVWSEAVLLEPMIQVLPVEGAEPSERTEIRLLFDRESLYLGIRMYDSDPSALIAKQMVHDSDMTSDDRINLILDTFNDHRNAYFFQINPVGTRSDALIENNRNFRRDWDGIWYAKASIDHEGWSAEFAIPFKTVSFDDANGIWGFEAERQIRRKNEVGRWANPSKNRTVVDVAGIGSLTGLREIDGTGIDVIPNGSLQATWDRKQRHGRDSTDSDLLGRPGAEVFYKFHSSNTAALTLNTDFMEAPVDDRRTELTRFPPFFPERRDFFLQDAGIFEFASITTNGLPYFSRRIGRLNGEPLDIDYGLKLTGRLGPARFGGLHVSLPEQSGIGRTELSVGRAQVNVLGESAIGIIGTHGDPRDQVSNSLLGADFQYYNPRVRGSNIVSGNAYFMRSFTSGFDDDQEAFGVNLAYPNDRYNGMVGFTQIGDDFNPALGFVNRLGIRQYDADFRFRVRPSGFLRSVDTGFETEFVTNRKNELESAVLLFNLLTLENNAGDTIKFTYVHDKERLLREPFEVDPGVVIPLGSYSFSRYGIRLATSNARPVSGIAEVIFGSFYSGHLRQVNATLEFRPNRHVFLALQYEQNDGRLREGDFTQRLARIRFNLAFTPEISWTNVLQYDNVADSMGWNSILRWEIEPGREFFLVFNHLWLEESSRFDSSHKDIGVKLVWTFRF